MYKWYFKIMLSSGASVKGYTECEFSQSKDVADKYLTGNKDTLSTIMDMSGNGVLFFKLGDISACIISPDAKRRENMKRLKELSREELVNLTEEEVNELIDLECMYEGKPLIVEKPKYLDIPELPEKDIAYYEVAGYVFTDKEDAIAIKEFIENSNSRVKLDYSGSNYDNKYVKKINDSDYEKPVTIKSGVAYSVEQYKKILDILNKIKEVKEINNDRKSEYDEIISQRSDVVNACYSAIGKASAELYEINLAINAFEKYLKLSGGNEEVATNFFKESTYGKLYDEVIKARAK